MKNNMIAFKCLFVVLLVLTFEREAHSAKGVDNEHWRHEGRLRQDLIAKFNGESEISGLGKVRPNASVDIGVRYSIFALNQLDVHNQRLALSGFLTVTWEDEQLTWDPADYGNVTDIYDDMQNFWRPQIIVDNEVDQLAILADEKLHMRATSRGRMTWEPPGVLVTYCSVDVTYYPFDTQLCKMEVTSWSYTLSEVNLVAVDENVDLEDYQVSGEWDVTATWAQRRVMRDRGEGHSQIDFMVRLRRRSAYYVRAVLLPVLVTAVLCVLVFILPPESGKVGYSLTILLTYTVMLTMVTDLMPPTSHTTSVLSVYLTLILVVGVVSCLLTMCVLYMHHHDDVTGGVTPLPTWLLRLNTNVLVPMSGWRRRVGKQPVADRTSRYDNIDLDALRTSQDLELKWREAAEVLDAVCWRVLGAAVVALTAVVCLVLAVGH